MTPQQQAENLLGLARRAGKLTMGEGFVLAAIRDGKAKLVLVASDASPRTLKLFHDKSSFYEIPYVNALTKLAIAGAIGTPRTALAVVDQGFATKLIKLLT
ncbi:MAG: ribosomal L7Ae/L30e/S12e/Gadd45 family protein [Lactobacillus sp.]|jgi:ribosomal protein L7Ae-like RNA K-turn-binding protein|nr:ribosomal L7Ae/L30e/S12e/Gadd45 family protein [Lactobacillus sp.]MCI2033808.1 ribosomal L7Ae/L30e/S12e/Gadd45 family protein [Lactobacillus sp.]